MGTIAHFGIGPISWRQWVRSTLATIAHLVPSRKPLQFSVQKSVPLGQKANATLLEIEGERLLLGVTSQSVSLLRMWKGDDAALKVRGSVR